MVKRTAEMVLGILGGLFGIFAGLGAGAVAFLGGIFGVSEAVDIFELAIVAIFASILGIIGGAIVNIKPKIAGAMMLIGAIVGLIAISAFYIIPMIFLGVAGILALVRKDESQLIDKAVIEPPKPNEKKHCGYCGADMATDGVFCPECGKEQPRKLTEVTETKKENKICTECGVELKPLDLINKDVCPNCHITYERK